MNDAFYIKIFLNNCIGKPLPYTRMLLEDRCIKYFGLAKYKFLPFSTDVYRHLQKKFKISRNHNQEKRELDHYFTCKNFY